MWFLLPFIVVNAVASNETFILEYRVEVAGLPLNILDLLIFVGLLLSFVRGSRFFRTDAVHPAFKWSTILFALAILLSTPVSIIRGIETYTWAADLRNFAVFPACMWIGYYLTRDPAAANRFAYFQVIGGVVASVVLLAFFRSTAAETTRYGPDLMAFRTVAFVSSYAGVAAAFLLFTIVAGVKLLPMPVTIGLLGLCTLGQIAPLHRSDWLACAAALMAAYVLSTQGNVGRRIVVGSLASFVLAATLWVGAYGAAKVAGGQFEYQLTTRLKSLLPGDQAGVRSKAWDTRIGPALVELGMWARSPIFGQGFGSGVEAQLMSGLHGFNHNVWTSTGAKAGIVGFAAIGIAIGGVIVVGRRMVQQRTDRTSVLIGGLGMVSGVFFLFHGLATMSFNTQRPAMVVALICGVVFRARAMQLTLERQRQEAALETQYGVPAWHDSMQPASSWAPEPV